MNEPELRVTVTVVGQSRAGSINPVESVGAAGVAAGTPGVGLGSTVATTAVAVGSAVGVATRGAPPQALMTARLSTSVATGRTNPVTWRAA